MAGRFGWCFLGSGKITRRVMKDLKAQAKISYLAAVYSPNPAHAKELADLYGAIAYPTPEEAILAPGVEGVYVAVPHPSHRACAELALSLGKPVLCEKPLTPTEKETVALTEAAKAADLYLAEAMWTRYNPVIRRVKEWVDSGAIGKVYAVEGDFSSSIAYDPEARIFRPEMAGGGILDVGIYPITLAQLIYGDVYPDQIFACGELTPSGVDAACGMLLRYPGGGVANLFTGTRCKSTSLAKIMGEDGVILLDTPFWKAKGATLRSKTGEERFALEPGDYEGFHFEFDAVAEEIRAGLKESPVVPWETSRRVAAIMDEVRWQMGIKFPFE